MSTPQFLQQFSERARRGRTAFERHQAAFLGWEYGLRMLASVALVEYAERGIQDDKLAPALQNLACPSLGHWWEIVRLLVKRLAEEGDAGFQQVQSVLLGKKRDDLLDCIRLDVALQRALNKGVEPVARHAVSLLELGDRLVAYRNIQYHAAIGLREDDFYAEMTSPMLAGISQLWLSVDVLAGRQLIYVADVRRLPTGNWRIDHWDLGQVQPESSYTDVAHERVASLPLANRLYVATRQPGPGGPATGDAWEARAWRLLYPLALYEPDQHELFLYGSSNQRKARVAYVGCVSGEHVQMVEGPEQLKLLSRLLHTAVSEAQLAQWAEKIQADIATSIPIPETQERRRLGEFTLLSRLGQGASGTVYRAWQPSLQRIVAVKRLLRANDPKAQERFLREIRSLGRVRHPHLVEAYNGGTDGEDVYFAMELVEGADLGRVIEQLAGSDVGRVDSRAWQTAVSSAHASARAQEQPLSADDEVVSSSAVARQSNVADAAARFSHGHVRHVVEMLRDVTDAVQALHDKQIIHRDIKPGNILVTSSGDAVLTDLGLAQLLDADTITRSQQFVGTVRYSSPEQMFDASRVDFRSDVYSLGATLWELLTLRPLLGITPELPLDEAFRRIRRHDPESVRTYNSQVPDDLARVIAKCLRKDETQRYRTAGELSSDLTRWLAGEPVLADNPTLGYLLSKALRRHAKPIAAAGLLLALLVALFFAWFVTVNRARNEALQAGTELKDALDRRDVALQGEERANRELSDKLVALNDETVRVLFASGCLKYEFGRVLEGQRELAQAYRLISRDNPRRPSYRRVLLDRLQVDRGLTLRHADTVTCLAFSPDGKWVVTGSADRTARLWDAQTGQPLGDVMRHEEYVTAVAFSFDGTRVVTGSSDKSARLWATETGKSVGAVMRHEHAVRAVAFSPDGTRVVTGADDGTAGLWDAQTGGRIGEVMPHESSVRSVAFNVDGTRVVTSAETSAHLWDGHTGKQIGEALGHEEYVTAVIFSPDGTRVVTGSEDKSARLWDALTGQPLGDVMPHEEYVTAVAFSPDGARVATAEYKTAHLWDARTGKPFGDAMPHDEYVTGVRFSPDGTRLVTSAGTSGRLWDARTGRLIGDDIRHEKTIKAIAFSPDGTRVVTGSSDKTARVWDAQTGRPIGEVLSHENSVHNVAFSPDGTQVVAIEYRSVHLWDAQAGRPIGDVMRRDDAAGDFAFSPPNSAAGTRGEDHSAPLSGAQSGKRIDNAARHEEYVISVAFSPDGTRVVTAEYGAARLWNAQTGQPIGEVMRHDAIVRAVAFSPDGTRIVTGSNDKSARLWDGQTGEMIGAAMPHDHYVTSVAFSPDGRRVVTGSSDRCARLWDTLTGRQIGEVMRHDDRVRAVAFSPDGTRIVTGSNDKSAQLWDGQTGEMIGQAMGHKSFVRHVAFSPDGTRVVTGSTDRTARLWDGQTGKPVGEVMRHEEYVTAVAFSPDGTRVVTGSSDKSARLWATETGKPIGDVMRHEHAVRAVAFSPDGTRVVTGSSDNSARLWDAQTGTPIGDVMRHEFPVNAVAFSPDNRCVVTGSADMSARLWDVRMAPVPTEIDLWVELHLGGEFDGIGNLKPYAEAELGSRYASVYADGKWLTEMARYRQTQQRNAHVFLLKAALARQQWFAGAFHSRWLANVEPATAEWWQKLALVSAEQEQWKEARVAYQKLLQDEPENLNWFYGIGLSDLAGREETLFQQHLNSRLPSASQSERPGDWYWLPYLAGLADSPELPRAELLDLARKAVGAAPNNRVYREVLGASLYRAGEFELGVTELERAIELFTLPGESYFTHAFLVLANFRRNKPEEVKKHRAILAQIARESPPTEWQERVRRRILDAEILAVCGPREGDG